MKKRIAITIGAAALVLGTAGSASAAPSGLADNPNSKPATTNCIAVYSSGSTHNGQATTLGQGGDPSHGARGAEIKGLQASCGAQS
jgi:hypothetical protein